VVETSIPAAQRQRGGQLPRRKKTRGAIHHLSPGPTHDKTQSPTQIRQFPAKHLAPQTSGPKTKRRPKKGGGKNVNNHTRHASGNLQKALTIHTRKSRQAGPKKKKILLEAAENSDPPIPRGPFPQADSRSCAIPHAEPEISTCLTKNPPVFHVGRSHLAPQCQGPPVVPTRPHRGGGCASANSLIMGPGGGTSQHYRSWSCGICAPTTGVPK